jgi:hypothetical protein
MAATPTCDWCAMSTVATRCPGQAEHCRLGQHCVSTVEVCALEWRHGENPGGHPRTCEHCHLPLNRRSE